MVELFISYSGIGIKLNSGPNFSKYGGALRAPAPLLGGIFYSGAEDIT